MNENPKILITGSSGLVGSKIVELLTNYQFEKLTSDITEKDKVTEEITNSDATIVIHLAAKTDVDGCERDKAEGVEGEAWKINVIGTKNIIDACLSSDKKLIHVSTDFVFDGKKEEPYGEEDAPNPINWYGKTKYEAEKEVLSSGLRFAVVRIAYPYRKEFERPDFVRKIISIVSSGQNISMVIDHVMTPTYIDDIALALDALIKNHSTGIFHVVGSEFITPYNLGLLICERLNISKSKILEIKREEFFKDRAPRPFHLALKNDKIRGLGVRMKTFEEGLSQLFK